MIHIVTLVVLTGLAAASIYQAYLAYGRDGRILQSIEHAVAEEVRRQDERIRKRVERSPGQDADNHRTEPTNVTLEAGDPWPGG